VKNNWGGKEFRFRKKRKGAYTFTIQRIDIKGKQIDWNHWEIRNWNYRIEKNHFKKKFGKKGFKNNKNRKKRPFWKNLNSLEKKYKSEWKQ